MRFSVDVGTCVRSADGFFACGDAACVVLEPACALLAVVDALGHGPDAAASAHLVTDVLEQSAGRSLADVFMRCDEALRGVRGAVLSAARVDDEGVWFAGIGNVELMGPAGVKRPVCSPGIVGRGIRRPREHALPVESGQRWFLMSDGIRARVVRSAIDASKHLAPAIAAQHILDHARRTDDDASVLVMDFSEGVS